MTKSFTGKSGCFTFNNRTEFKFYCPKASHVICEIFTDLEQDEGDVYPMESNEDGYWSISIPKNLSGCWYGYRMQTDDQDSLCYNSPYYGELFADPYSRHVAVKNNYRQEAKTLIFEDTFDWENDQHQFPDDPRDLIIYESHLKDLTAHSSSGASGEGFYKKFVDSHQKGGLPYLKSLGVNCIEFLPLQKFAVQEPPYNIRTPEGFHNTWNVYSCNYWGYMTSFFFAPEASYASDRTHRFSGKTVAAVNEFKNVVKHLHQNGISVIMDVVYNHTSLFDKNPLTYLCPDVYLRKNDKGEMMNRSGTGNEFKSENSVARQLMLDSILYWMDEYHIDGFRFDLAALLDKKSWKMIHDKVKKKYPKAILIAEPWGGHYSPAEFSNYDWASWNDRIRNSIKGSDPIHDKGFIFSDWQHETERGRLENVFKGTLANAAGGLFQSSAHSVNYLESHDGYTLADFIRIGLNPELQDVKITNFKKHAKLNDDELRRSQFAALCLFVSQGITMIHAGQEFGRSKIIAKTPCNDPDEGKMDHNSYQKDNETNWLNFDHINSNKKLIHYYRQLIKIRQMSPALRKSSSESIHSNHYGDPLLISFYIDGKSAQDIFDYFIILNANSFNKAELYLPNGTWEQIVNNGFASTQAIEILSGQIKINPVSGMLLRKLRH